MAFESTSTAEACIADADIPDVTRVPDTTVVLTVVKSLFLTLNFEPISLHQSLHHSCGVIN
jgi:hypothetical protein